jgi:hypothetical protein
MASTVAGEQAPKAGRKAVRKGRNNALRKGRGRRCDAQVEANPAVWYDSQWLGKALQAQFTAAYLACTPVQDGHLHIEEGEEAKAEGGGRGSLILARTCWDFQSSGGCTRPGCNYIHCPLDSWQMSWLRLQRFCFGGQLSTFDDLASLAAVAKHVFLEEARLAVEAPPAAKAGAQAVALRSLGDLGYPFEVPPSLGACDQDEVASTSGCRPERVLLLQSVRELAASAVPGAEALPVGSFAWGVDTDGSDLDVVVVPPVTQNGSGDTSGHAILDSLLATLEKLQKSGTAPNGLQEAEWAHYDQTSVPVVTLRAQVNGQLLGVDICAFGQLGSIRDAMLFH